MCFGYRTTNKFVVFVLFESTRTLVVQTRTSFVFLKRRSHTLGVEVIRRL